MSISIKNMDHMVKKGNIARGSVTVETSLSLFLFLIFFVCMMYFYMILNLEMKVQSSLEQTADVQAAYAAVKNYDDKELNISFIECSLNQMFAKTNVIRLTGADYLDSTWIEGGSSGLYFGESKFLEDDITLNLVVSYNVKIPFFSIGTIKIVQNAHRRIWYGDDTSGKNSTDITETMVYVTPNGVVYHLYSDCSYIDVKLQAVDGKEVSSKRNEDGSKYYPCESCHPDENGTVYITSYGNRYHCSENCKAIEKDVKEISIKDVGNRHLCSKCEKKAAG